LEFPELVGHLSVRANANGMSSMEFDYGPLALAMLHGGLFLLNEIDLLDPATAAGLNGILDGQPLCIAEKEGELIIPHPMFRFAATGNSNGSADETGLYQGIQRQNIAFMDRFQLCELAYPDPQAEEKLLLKVAAGLPEEIRKKMVDYAGEVRRLFMGEATSFASGIEITFSTRTLLRWADLTLRYKPLAEQGIRPLFYALDRALGFRACRETRAMLHELLQRIFPDTRLKAGKRMGECQGMRLPIMWMPPSRPHLNTLPDSSASS
jgi:cobaltochelatase CobS